MHTIYQPNMHGNQPNGNQNQQNVIKPPPPMMQNHPMQMNPQSNHLTNQLAHQQQQHGLPIQSGHPQMYEHMLNPMNGNMQKQPSAAEMIYLQQQHFGVSNHGIMGGSRNNVGYQLFPPLSVASLCSWTNDINSILDTFISNKEAVGEQQQRPDEEHRPVGATPDARQQ